MQMPHDREGWLRLIGGSLLILIGIAGIFLPIVPGIILILAGMVTINPDSERINGWFERGRRLLKRRNIARRWYGVDEEVPGEADA